MNKNIFVGLCLVLTFCFAAFAYASVDTVYEVAVINLKGDVQVDPRADGKWIKPWIGMKLKKEALIKTGDNSFIEVVFDSEGLNVLRIKEGTLVAIHKANVELTNGSVLAAFANLKEGSTFSVKTPTAVCGIRGSGMGVDFINNMTVVSAYEHSVYVQGIDADGNIVGMEVVIPEGWKAQVLENGVTTPPEGLTENEQQIFDAWVSLVTGPDTGPGDGDGEGDDDGDVDNKDLEELKEEESGGDDISPTGESYGDSPGYSGE